MSNDFPGSPDNPPDKCFHANAQGDLPTCSYSGDGMWHRSYPDAAGDGFGAGFGALFVLVLLVGIGTTIWKVSTAQRMARNSGMDVGDATAMTLLTDDGLEATYLASNLRVPQQPSAPTAGAPARTPEQRLRELESLRSQDLVTEEEYAARRRAILDSL